MTDFRAQHEQVEALRLRLDAARRQPVGAVAAADREALKQEIIALFRQAQMALADAQAFKESVRGLVDSWKAIDAVVSMNVPRLDHLGAATFIEKGWTRLSLEDFAGAEAALRRALELVPEQNEAESLLSWALMLQQKLDDAMSAAQAVLTRDPSCAVAHVCQGYVAMQQGHNVAALELLSHAIALDGDHKATLYAHLYLGMVYERLNRPDDAEHQFRRTLELGPNCLQAWYERGRNHWAQGRRDAAMGAWRSGSEANKFSPWGKRCAEVMTRVEQGGDPLSP